MEAVLQALADDERLAVLAHLLTHDGASQSELREALGIPLSRRGTLSKHMARLEQARLVARSGDEYAVAFPELVRRAIQATAELAREMATREAADAEALARRLRLRDIGGKSGGGGRRERSSRGTGRSAQPDVTS